ncbi:MAG: hypothetical protein LC102_05665 [Ignavibacteriales bacterium]|jgi:hypothetical protein|nr:MAG: hypothetical protein F9K26_09175 [Ignavibacteriaceae bacterium]MBW7874121.1 hypothetical protein [Ignavibacteria bacterium]MCZ2142896.1 hypothetical protein [Ignavibacteriales bacterium]MBV6444549.1 hypothetical protein [Ignavibacteriaceae bacterium]MBZ0197939.1 hypothetical protein [Ignavibacteriaceae bacterium]
MIEDIRKKYNKDFTEAKYNAFIDDMNNSAGVNVDFRICETPLFLSKELTAELTTACCNLIEQLDTPEYRKFALGSVPKGLSAPNRTEEHPVFLQIDFAICSDGAGGFIPQLIELQGFPSLYGFQVHYDDVFRRHFELPEGFSPYYSGFERGSYVKLLKETLLGDSDPENVILLEIEPDKQKTLIDFTVTEKLTGVKPVCITDVIKRGKKLFYESGGKEIPIQRIYNRVIFDELIRKDVKADFSFQEELDVHWVGHPDWFFLISKYSLPRLTGKYVPECHFLSDLTEYPADLENFVLKPLFSFAGLGVEVDVTKETLDAKKERENYILQRKIEYAPLVKTPDGFSKCEIRMMFLWNDKPVLVNNLTRFSKGKMMGVDFNKNKTWVGSATAYHPV